MMYERIVPVLVSLIICLHHGVLASQCPDRASSVGKEFMFGVCGVPDTSQLYVYMASTSNTPAQVRITAPFNNYDSQHTVSNKTVVSLSTSLIQSESGRQFKGIEINSDIDISVSVIPYSSYYDTEGFLVLPTSALSTRYVAASYHPYSSYKNEILVAGIDGNTDVTFNYTTDGKSYTTAKVRLQKFQTYQLLVNHDLSGAVITSNKPIAVFAGSAYSQIPVGIGTYNYIVEQMIPTKYWDKQYIVPPFYPHNYYIVKVFADEDNTEIQYYNSTKHFAAYMDKGSFVEILLGSEPVVILSTKPVSVIQYFHDGENMYGNPFMTTVQGLGQYLSSYKFYTENFDSTTSTIAVTVKRNDSSGLILNGKSMSSWSAKTRNVSRPVEDYVTLFVNISYNTFYNIHHTGGIKFGATLYGRFHPYTAYGYPLQLALSNIECTTTTNIPGVIPSHHNNTNGGHHVYEIGNGTWCFQCENMSHLQYCDKVTRCHTQKEVCYIQRYTRSNNVQLYRSGCMPRNTCQSYGDQIDCQQCCNGSFCNVAGCGDDGLPSFQSRGPFCFDCEHQGADEVCQTIQMCRLDQVCKIETYEWGSGYHNIMGCADNQFCKAKREVRETHARHAPVCYHCCHSDFCNMNCTAAHFQQVVGMSPYVFL
ncbi:uncharacterized protein LOC123560552 [Mercenaria mercenaria]|uniref:uncharacterized protein LOC123560552 n=1 Tax=Mercenaria mercenaria TaxID=6596 RepID=UPI00234F1407|nr:uncharacterized protein LOC123560552 [Mercenaria mercenaria]